jgi:hypothetical protein
MKSSAEPAKPRRGWPALSPGAAGPRKAWAAMACFFSLFPLAACAVRPVSSVPQRVEGNLGPILAVIETGDWLVARGTHGPDNFISSVTNMPFSHAAVYDAETGEVVEAVAKGVVVATLEDFLGRSSRVWVVKPVWATPENRPKAVARARANVGRKYNYLGLLGLSIVPGTYYCSELAIDAWRPFMDKGEDNPIPLVVSPGRLHHWGRVVYDSMEIGPGRNKGAGDEG